MRLFYVREKRDIYLYRQNSIGRSLVVSKGKEVVGMSCVRLEKRRHATYMCMYVGKTHMVVYVHVYIYTSRDV